MKLKSLIYFFAIICILQIAVFAQTNDVLINQAKDAIAKDDYASAMSNLDIIFKRNPNDEAALTQRARAFVRQSKYAEAMADVTKVLSKNPNNYEALNVRGVVKRGRDKDLSGALADFTKAVAIQPDFYLGFVNIGLTNRLLNKYKEAFAAYNKAIEISPNNYVAYNQRGVSFLQYRKYKEAIADFDKVQSLVGETEDNLINRGYCHFRMYLNDSKPSRELAKTDVEKTLAINPKNAVALGIRSLFKYEDNDYNGANSDSEKSLQSDPKMYIAMMTRGFIKIYANKTQGNYDYNSGLEEFDKALKIVPNNTWVKEKRDFVAQKATSPLAATIREEIKKEKEAKEKERLASAKIKLENAKQKVISNPWNYNAYVDLSDAFSNAKTDKAIKDEFFGKLIGDNPNNICAVLFSNKIHFMDYGLQIAAYEELFRKYDGKNGKTCAALIATNLAQGYTQRNKFDEAKVYLAKAKELQPNLKAIADATEYNETNLADDTAWQKALDNAPINRRKIPSDIFADLTPEQRKKAKDRLDEMEVKDKKLLEAQNDYASVSEKINEHIDSLNRLQTKLGSDKENAKTYATQMKSETEAIIRLYTNFLSKYENKLEKTGVKRRDDVIVLLNAEMAGMRKEIDRSKERIKLFEQIINS